MDPRVPETLIRSIVATYAPRRIVLFGSQAQHAADTDSDLDLLVVLDDDAPPEACRGGATRSRKRYDGAVDMIPCRAHVLAERARAAGSFADTIVNNGVIVYERHCRRACPAISA